MSAFDSPPTGRPMQTEARAALPGPRVALLAMALIAAVAIGPAGAEEVALLQGLDKVTARISPIRAPIDLEIPFGTLRITARACRTTPPEEAPESAAFLEIRDARLGERPILVFSGWVFASSPALSGLEHPVYDVWVVDCKNVSNSDGSSAR